ncbi:MAG TPA: TonB-dependent receptor plug domain-containing protein, partial [Rhodocyclaceae bacterium]|nr:TonB-dependent receptor plug domain-containing protein [Rhodocyclaceae bacterium]
MHQIAARLALVLPAVAGGPPALAQAAEQTPTPLQEIVVAAERLPGQPVTDRLAPRRAATGDTASLLNEGPGVELQGAGGVASLPVIRGMADDRNRIKVDGMDLIAACANHMNPPLSYLAPGNLGTVKVYAGITPVSVGGDSIGSTIVADSPAPEFAPPGGESIARGKLGAFYRSNGDARGVDAAASLASSALSLRYHGAASAAGNTRAGGDFRTNTATGRIGHALPRDEIGSTAYRARNHALDLATRLGADLVEAKFGYQDIPEQLWPNQRMDMLGNRQLRTNLRYL